MMRVCGFISGLSKSEQAPMLSTMPMVYSIRTSASHVPEGMARKEVRPKDTAL